MDNRHEINEIIPNVFITSIIGAANYSELHELGITHIVNLSRLDDIYPKNFAYLKIDVPDEIDANIIQYFDEALHFIHSALLNNGKVLVHCKAGKSRSPTIVIAYICTYYQRSLFEVIDYVKMKRPIVRPNLGFINQLIWYTNGSH